MGIDETHEATAPNWAESFVGLRREMDEWISNSAARHRDTPFLGLHDEGSFIASWLCHYQLTRDPGILEFARWLRDGFAAWGEANLVHGFFPRGEVHHQTEIFNSFLLRLWHVAPDDLTAHLILDAAEHIGNWVPGVPEWYDWESDRFLAWHIGTVSVGDGESDGVEVPDHFRLIQLAVGAHLISGEDRYLDLSARWARRWAAAIVEHQDAPPSAMLAGDVAAEGLVATAAGAQHAGAGGIGLIEPYVAAGAVDVLLDLHELLDEPLYAEAARALCSHLIGQVADPYANPVGALLRRYRVVLGNTEFDGPCMTALGDLSAAPCGDPAMIVEEVAPEPIAGIGKRADMVTWAYRDENGALLPERSPAPSALMLAHQITGDSQFAARAMEMAARRLNLARHTLRDGRRHGCGARSVSAVASGHGRDAGYGNVTGAFYALAHGATKYGGHERPAVALMGGDGLAKEAAALTRMEPGHPVTAEVWYDGEVCTVEAL